MYLVFPSKAIPPGFSPDQTARMNLRLTMYALTNLKGFTMSS